MASSCKSPAASSSGPHFKLASNFEPRGSQPQAIRSLVEGLKSGSQWQTLLGRGRISDGKWYLKIGRRVPELVNRRISEALTISIQVEENVSRDG